MDRMRASIEDFVHRLLWRYGVWGRRALAVALVAGAIVGAVLLWRRVLRALPTVVTIGATLALAVWFVLGFPGLPDEGSRGFDDETNIYISMPRTSAGPVVENGVAAVVTCGKKRGMEGIDAAVDYAPEPGTGGWSWEEWGDCTVWYHHPPNAEQRENRHQRAELRRQRAEPPQPERLTRM